MKKKFKIIGIALMICLMTQAVFAQGKSKIEPQISSVSTPAMPGKLSVVVGYGWKKGDPELKVKKIQNGLITIPKDVLGDISFKDAEELRISKEAGEALTVEFPSGEFAVYAVAATNNGRVGKPFIVNKAILQWLSSEYASSGDVVRAFGKNLVDLGLYKGLIGNKLSGYGEYIEDSKSLIVLENEKGKTYFSDVIKHSAYDIHFVIPEGLKAGKYKVYAHNGLGGEYGWSNSDEITIEGKKIWPAKVFDVTDYGATGRPDKNDKNNWHDDSEGIQKALDAAKANGGGVVYFPPGSYYSSKTLVIHKYTAIKGAGRGRSWIWFPDGIDHGGWKEYELPLSINVGMRGISDFSIEDISIHSTHTNVLIAAPLTRDKINVYTGLDKTRAKNITIKNCYIAHEPTYRYHHRKKDPLLNNSTMNDESWGMKATIAIRGDNISVTDCKLKGGGMAVAYLTPRYSTIARNEIFIGRSANAFTARETGWPETRPEKCIFEDNDMIPSANHHSGFWSHGTSRYFYMARNNFQLTWTSDAEGILWHGTGPQQIYELEGASAGGVVVKNVGNRIGVKWACVVVKGKGLGQYRMTTAVDGNKVKVDQPWDIIPDENSKIAVLYHPGHVGHIVVGNKLFDTGAGIFGWGEAVDWVVDGNYLERAGGVQFSVVTHESRPWSGNYFISILNNTVTEGRFFETNTHQNWTIGRTGTTGYDRRNLRGCIGSLGQVYRNNNFIDDSSIAFWDLKKSKYDDEQGSLVDVATIVEDNKFRDCVSGISVGSRVSAVLRHNQFINVENPITIKESADVTEE